MRKAFTMLELVIVIVVIGILAAMAIPRLERDNLAEAVDQIVSHIRYTQHLAMQDNKFRIDLANPAGNTRWYRQRWSITFSNANVRTKGASWRYSIFFDRSLSGNLNSVNEVAPDPQNSNQLMSAGWSSGTISDADLQRTSDKYDIGRKFGITQVGLGGTCGSNGSQTISFDEFGRPMQVVSTTTATTGAQRGYDRILVSGNNCFISIRTADRNATIYISPETGFARVSY